MAESPQLIALATAAAQEAGIEPTLLLGLVRQESAWNPGARSGAGALGLTQVMPIWTSPSYANEIGMTGITPADLLNPETSLRVGARILATELKRFGSAPLALMAYNAGATAVSKAIQRAGTTDPEQVSNQLPAAETRAYWQKVMNWADSYAQKISELQAQTENAVTTVTEETKQAGAAAPLLIFAAAMLGLVLWLKR
jgi:soluble lytic murein transglycosylase